MGAVEAAPIDIPGWKGENYETRYVQTACFHFYRPRLPGRGSQCHAYRHLVEWPASQRDGAHSVALKACSAALRGEIEAETARGLFAAFADKHDLLAPETNVIAASRSRRDKDPHVV